MAGRILNLNSNLVSHHARSSALCATRSAGAQERHRVRLAPRNSENRSTCATCHAKDAEARRDPRVSIDEHYPATNAGIATIRIIRRPHDQDDKPTMPRGIHRTTLPEVALILSVCSISGLPGKALAQDESEYVPEVSQLRHGLDIHKCIGCEPLRPRLQAENKVRPIPSFPHVGRALHRAPEGEVRVDSPNGASTASPSCRKPKKTSCARSRTQHLPITAPTRHACRCAPLGHVYVARRRVLVDVRAVRGCRYMHPGCRYGRGT